MENTPSPSAVPGEKSPMLLGLNALVLFSLITTEIFQLTHRYRYQFVGEVMTDMKSIKNDPMYNPRDSEGNEKIQFLFLLLFALTF